MLEKRDSLWDVRNSEITENEASELYEDFLQKCVLPYLKSLPEKDEYCLWLIKEIKG